MFDSITTLGRSTLVATLFLIGATLASAALAQGEIQRYGTVNLSSVAMMGTQQAAANAAFYELPEGMDAPTEEDFYAHERIDRCFVSEGGQMPLEQPDPPDTTLLVEDAEPISAGAEVTIRVGGADFLVLPRRGDTYSATASQPLPESATVEIPGADGGFPAFSGQVFPEARPVTFTAPEDLQAIASETTFTWSETVDLGVVMIVMQGTDAGGADASAVCFAADDGEFSLADRTGLEGVTPRAVMMYGRNAVATFRDGDALLSLSTFTSSLAMQTPGLPPMSPQ